jgi:hypothetical protein
MIVDENIVTEKLSTLWLLGLTTVVKSIIFGLIIGSVYFSVQDIISVIVFFLICSPFYYFFIRPEFYSLKIDKKGVNFLEGRKGKYKELWEGIEWSDVELSYRKYGLYRYILKMNRKPGNDYNFPSLIIGRRELNRLRQLLLAHAPEKQGGVEHNKEMELDFIEKFWLVINYI